MSHHPHETHEVSDGVLLWTVIINLGLSAFEFVAGIIAGSIALKADALHNTNDAGALLVAYIARKISKRGADRKFTFGYRRAELIGAMIQLTALLLIGLYLVYEAIHRFVVPEPPLGGWMMAAAGVALVVDFLTAWLLWAMAKGSLNVRAAFLHNLADAGASIAVLLGGAAVFWLGWSWVDPAMTLVIAGYILLMSLGMLKRTSSILMEGAPDGLDIEELITAALEIEGITDFHHVHVWELDEHHWALEAQVRTSFEDYNLQQKLKDSVKSLLKERFDINHATLEFGHLSPEESGDCHFH